MSEIPCRHDGPGPVPDPRSCPQCLRSKVAALEAKVKEFEAIFDHAFHTLDNIALRMGDDNDWVNLCASLANDFSNGREAAAKKFADDYSALTAKLSATEKERDEWKAAAEGRTVSCVCGGTALTQAQERIKALEAERDSVGAVAFEAEIATLTRQLSEAQAALELIRSGAKGQGAHTGMSWSEVYAICDKFLAGLPAHPVEEPKPLEVGQCSVCGYRPCANGKFPTPHDAPKPKKEEA